MASKIDAGCKSTLEGKFQLLRKRSRERIQTQSNAATDDLANTSMNIFGKVYQSAQGAAGAQGADPNMGTGASSAKPDDDVVDADYEVVDDDK